MARVVADEGAVAGACRAVRPATGARVSAVWRLGYRRSAWRTGIGLGAVTVAASLVAGLRGAVASTRSAVVLSVPVWLACWRLVRRV